jgi:hypothetical protein
VRSRILNWVAFAGVVLPLPAAAQAALQVDAAPCASRIHVRAQDVPLGEILGSLSKAMGFRLDAKVALTERVSIDRADTPEALLKHLMQNRNLVLQADPNPKCNGRETLTTVWVLPTGQDAPRVADKPTAPATAATPAPAKPLARQERPRGTRRNTAMTEEQWQQMKRDYLAGKVKADPETGKPVPVEEPPSEAAPR